jgi:hypothetical protein
VFCISVLEHIPDGELDALMRRCWSLMKPGGLFVATIDLFLNAKPFCGCDRNEFGANISVRRIVQSAPFELVHGEPCELYGFPDFCCDSVLSKSHLLLLGAVSSVCADLVLRKMTTSAHEAAEDLFPRMPPVGPLFAQITLNQTIRLLRKSAE